MALKPDFQDALQIFIYSNLPILMNPANAMNVVVSNEINPITPTTPITPTIANTPTAITPTTAIATAPISTNPAIGTAPILTISPQLLSALQSYAINNFPDIGIPRDIQQVAKNFIANLPPLLSITPNIAVTGTVAMTTVTTTANTVTTNPL